MQRGTKQWWRELLIELSRVLLTDPRFAYLREYEIIPKAMTSHGWLGNQGAAESDIEKLEIRIARRLPRSYRELLLASDGFFKMTNTIGRLLRTAEVDLYSRREPDLVRMLMKEWKPSWVDLDRYRSYDRGSGRAPIGDYRGDHLDQVIEITQDSDGATILLDPLTLDSSDEWEAWNFAPGRTGGALRYRSLPDLVEDNLRMMRDAVPSGL